VHYNWSARQFQPQCRDETHELLWVTMVHDEECYSHNLKTPISRKTVMNIPKFREAASR